jgi:hypothetical protein
MSFTKIQDIKSAVDIKEIIRLYKSGKISAEEVQQLKDDKKISFVDFCTFLDSFIPDKNFFCTWQTTDLFDEILKCQGGKKK